MLGIGALGQLALAQISSFTVGAMVPSPPIVPPPSGPQYPVGRLQAGPRGYDGDDFLLMPDAKISYRGPA